VSWSKAVLECCCDNWAVLFTDACQGIAHEVNPATLDRSPQHFGGRGLQSFMFVCDDQLDRAKANRTKRDKPSPFVWNGIRRTQSLRAQIVIKDQVSNETAARAYSQQGHGKRQADTKAGYISATS
jgi:hypothetical protein